MNSGGSAIFLVHKHPDNPRERVDLSSGLFSFHASQLLEHEALARKTAAAFSNALSIAEYVYILLRSARDLRRIQGGLTPP